MDRRNFFGSLFGGLAGLFGLSKLKAAEADSRIAKAMGSCVPGGWVGDHIQDDELERIRREFERTYNGPSNHGKLMIMPKGCQIEELDKMDKSRFYTMQHSFNPAVVLNPEKAA